MQLIGKVPIMDARKKAVIHIKPLDVTRGKKGSPGKCAAARACVHDLGAKHALVHVSRTYIELPAKEARQYGKPPRTRGPVWVRFQTPVALRTEVALFDRAAKFQPGEYTLPPPSHRTTGKRQGSAKIVKRRSYKRPSPRHVMTGVRTFKPGELRTAA